MGLAGIYIFGGTRGVGSRDSEREGGPCVDH
jgi:hypothetical protein